MTAGLSPDEMRLVEEYDAATEKYIEDEKPIDRKGIQPAELYRLFESMDLDYIKELHLDIGVMKAVLERFSDDDAIQQMAHYFIRLNFNLIDNLKHEVLYDREQAEKFGRISG
jgi:hypothetical protein